MTKIVVFSSRQRGGKDTSIDYIMSKLQLTLGFSRKNELCEKYSFAERLKGFLIEVFDLTENQCYGDTKDKSSLTKIKWANLPISKEKLNQFAFENFNGTLPEFLTAREFMQIFGTEICRHIDQDCWARATKKLILEESPEYAFISDARFPNEIDVFANDKDNPLYVFRLLRNPHNSNHKSEVALDSYDFNKPNHWIIDNQNLSLEDKNELVWNIFQKEVL